MPKLRNIALATVLLWAGTAAAQAPDPLRYSVVPETPGPNQEVTITVEGVGTFLGDATLTWSVDGAVAKQGAGERTFTLTTGALGSRTVVRVDIVSATEGRFSKTFTLAPSVVTMVWEADTSVPPLYRGKPLYSAGSPLKVIAYPTVFAGGSRIAKEALSYRWIHNDEPVTQVSGAGRYTYSFTGDQLKNAETVSVEVYYGSAKVAQGDVVIPAASPRAVLYQYDALRGPLYDSALPGGIALSGNEISFKAEPYYFSNVSKAANALAYEWQLNGSETTGPDAQRGILTLRQAGDGAGAATLGVTIQNYDSSTFVQTGEALLEIVFGQQPSSALGNLFGL